ncbi:uroporphyrinogen-III synthase [Thiohalorhabdus sp.]|uniref:uroporphyrinogen-III synthase n=1 Tax=Thiohalorhabdus sp. TaxID=3094134 RepID=UPI002FC2AFDB
MSEPAGRGDWAGCRILVTRPVHQSTPLRRAIEARGGEVLLFPTIVIGPPADQEPWRAVAGRLAEFDWLVFVSVNAVNAFAERLAASGLAWPTAPAYAAIGAKTAADLTERCGRSVLTPPDFRSESLLDLPEMTAERVAGQRVLLLRGEGGRELLPQTLAERGARVTRLPVYARQPPQASPRPVQEALIQGRIHAVVLTSPDTFVNLLDVLDEAARTALAQVVLVVISPVTARAVTERGFAAPVVAPEASDEGLVRALDEHVCPHTPKNHVTEAR